MKTKKKWLIGGTILILLATLVIGASSNYLGAFKPKLTTAPSSIKTMEPATTKVKAGTLSVEKDASSPVENQIAPGGEDDLLVARFKLTATDEDFEVDTMTFAVTNSSGSLSAGSSLADCVASLTLLYPTSLSTPSVLDGSTLSAIAGINSQLTSLGLMVPKDSHVYVELYADLADHSLEGGSLDSDDALSFTLNTSGTGGEFEATGLTSGTTVTESDLGDITADTITYVYRTIPTVANATSLGSSLITGTDQEVYRFTVSADSNGDVVLQYVALQIATTGLETTGTNSLSNDISCSDSYDYTNAPIYITEHGKSTKVGIGCYNTATGTAAITMNVSSSGGTNSGTVISAGNTKTFSVYADVYEDSSTSTAKTISTKIKADNNHVNAASVSSILSADPSVGLIWSDYGSASGTHGESTAEWMNGYKVPGMPVSYVTLS